MDRKAEEELIVELSATTTTPRGALRRTRSRLKIYGTWPSCPGGDLFRGRPGWRARRRGRVYGSGRGRSKKEAEQQAAEAAWSAISEGETGTPAGEAGSGEDAAGQADTHPADHHAGGNGAGARSAARARGAAQASPADHGTGPGQDS